MRHATARSHGESDHGRELTRRGSAEAAEVARALLHADLCPDHAVVSAATRTRQTWLQLERACGVGQVSYDESLYAASAEIVMDVLRLLPAEAATAAYVGHNPAAEYVAAVLSDGEGDPEAMRDLLTGMTPATAAVFEVTCEWADLAPGCARLIHVLRPHRA
jgi:phosphohistidine phosphatase